MEGLTMLSLRKVVYGFGGPPLLDGVSLEVAPGDRLGLVGRNGSGKSTLFRLILGEAEPDEGELDRAAKCRIERMGQSAPDFDGGVGAWVRQRLEDPVVPEWEIEGAVERLLEELGLDPDAAFSTLSAGMRRQVELRVCLGRRPDLLLLDEPTNHLDLDAIEAMEEALLDFRGALLFITHDRWFLRRLSTAILDLDRGQLSRWDCDYETYLLRKQEWLDGEEKRAAVFDKKLAREEAWIRQGIKARRTRNEGRVRALEQMRRERRQRREEAGRVRMEMETAERSGSKVVETVDLHKAYEGRVLIQSFSTVIRRGDRIGIIGPNGAGKSTLIRLLLGEIAPDAGEVIHGTRLETAYFDQMRASLDPQSTVRDVVADGNETVEVGGRRRHVVGYLQDFLFDPARIQGPVKSLSGGEVNRLLLARIFARPFNLLVLDEPTNDLDLETLDLLEEQLSEYQGTLLMVSHDRDFLDRVVTELYVVDGRGGVESFIGGYRDWESEIRARRAAAGRSAGSPVEKKGAARRPQRFLNRERRELEQLPAAIETLEGEQARLSEALADLALYTGPPGDLARLRARLAAIDEEIQEAFSRWETLEASRRELEG